MLRFSITLRKLILLLGILIFVTAPSANAYLLTNSYTNLSNQNIFFEKFDGSLLFVEAFSTTCVYCIQEHDELVKLYDEYGNQIYMLSLSINSNDNIDTLTQFVNDYPMGWEIGLDYGSKFQQDFDIRSTPTMLLFNQEGRLLTQKVGFTEFSELSQMVSGYLAISNPRPSNTIDSFEGNDNSGSLIEDLFASNFFRIAFFSLLVIMVYMKLSTPKTV
ncbi:MAG: TlpA family protein disulfide reductase [Candidatus Heimdallarchaeota archaeon]|nr:TlpA family protein disulfide reductase [Candidatus Heimdallarchaeota archaeon]